MQFHRTAQHDDEPCVTVTLSRREVALIYQCVGSRGTALRVSDTLMQAWEDLALSENVRTFERTPLVKNRVLG